MWEKGGLIHRMIFWKKKKRALKVRKAKRMVDDKNEWQGFVSGNFWDLIQEINLGISSGGTVVLSDSFLNPLVVETFEQLSSFIFLFIAHRIVPIPF